MGNILMLKFSHTHPIARGVLGRVLPVARESLLWSEASCLLARLEDLRLLPHVVPRLLMALSGPLESTVHGLSMQGSSLVTLSEKLPPLHFLLSAFCLSYTLSWHVPMRPLCQSCLRSYICGAFSCVQGLVSWLAGDACE